MDFLVPFFAVSRDELIDEADGGNRGLLYKGTWYAIAASSSVVRVNETSEPQ